MELDPDVPEQFETALGFMQNHDFDLGIQDIEAGIRWIRREAGVPKVGLVGFCMGGRIAYLAATHDLMLRSAITASVSTSCCMNRTPSPRRCCCTSPPPDGFVSPEAQKANARRAGWQSAHVTLFDYEGLDHGFADTFGARRDETGAQLADQRTADFFAQHLG